MGRALGWSCVTALVVLAGLDNWDLFYLGMRQLELPLCARVALQRIHDAGSLKLRVVCEFIGALAGSTGLAMVQRRNG